MNPAHLEPPPAADAPPHESPQAARMLDAVQATMVAGLVGLLALMFGGVTPLGHVVAVVGGALIAVVSALRCWITRSHSWSLVMVPAGLFAALVALQGAEFGLATLERLQGETAATWRELLGSPASEAASRALEARPLSLAPEATWEQLRLLVVGLVLLWSSAQLAAQKRSLVMLLGGLAAVGAGVALVGVAQTVSGTDQILWTFQQPRPVTGGPFVHRGHFAQFVNLGLGAVFALLFVRLADRSPHRSYRVEELFEGVLQPGRRIDLLLLIAAVVCLTAVGLSQARNGVISTLVGGVVLAAVVGRTRFLQGVGWPLVGMLFVAFGAVLVLGFDPVYDRFANLPDEVDNADYGRLAIWRDALALWQAYPTFGAGFGSFEWTFPAFDTSTRVGTVAHAESLYVEVLAETGWVGTALIGLAVGGLVWVGARRARKQRLPRHAAVFGMGFGLVALAFQQTTDFGAKTPAVAALGLVSAGVVLGVAGRAATGVRPALTGLVLGGALAALLGAQVPGALASWQRMAAAEQAVDLKARVMRAPQNELESLDSYQRKVGRLEEAHRIGEAAGLHDSVEIEYWRAALSWREAVAAQLPTGVRDAEAARILEQMRASEEGNALQVPARAARDMLLTARTAAPTHGRLWSLAGQLERAWLGNPAGIELLERGARLAPHDPLTCAAYGQALLDAGETGEAVVWLRRAMEMGRALPGRKYIRGVLQMMVLEGAPNDAVLAAAAGSVDTLRDLHRVIAEILASGRQADGQPEPGGTGLAIDRARLQQLSTEAGRAFLDLFEATIGRGERLPVGAWLFAAKRSEEEGLIDLSASCYRYTLRLMPHRDEHRLALAQMFARAGRYDDARDAAARIPRGSPQNGAAQRLIDGLPK